MITQLYTFSVGSYVVADEWNANFNTLYNVNLAHEEAIIDAQNTIAFPDSDLTTVFNSVRGWANSFFIGGDTVMVAPQCEYYKTLATDQDLTINIPTGLNSEVRVLIQLTNDRSLRPFTVNYNGTTIINDYDNNNFLAGFYYIMIYESNNTAMIKVIGTGV
jgi:hypothetical protein